MVRILEIKPPGKPWETKEEDQHTWTIEVIGEKKEDILILKDLIDDHAPISLLICKGIKFNRGFPSFELGAKLYIESYSTLPKQEITQYLYSILNKIIP